MADTKISVLPEHTILAEDDYFPLVDSVAVATKRVKLSTLLAWLAGSIGSTQPYTTYYVDTAAADDTGSGLTPATAWKTISKVNASTFLPGDAILFKRGCSWAEKLMVPSAGSAGNYITFADYGAGALPIIATPAGGKDCIGIDGKPYVHVRNFIVTGAGANEWKAGVSVVQGSHFAIVENVESYSNNLYGVDVDSSNDVQVINCIGRNSFEGVNFRNGATRGQVIGGSYHDNWNKNVLCEGGGVVTATGVTAYNSGHESFHVRYADSKLICVNCLSHNVGTVDASSGVDYDCVDYAYLELYNCIGHTSPRYGIQQRNNIDEAGGSTKAYNCTFYDHAYSIAIFNGSIEMRNCLLVKQSWDATMNIVAGVTVAFNNNAYWNTDLAGTKWLFGATTYPNLAAYQAGQSQDAAGVVGDPLMTNPAAAVFTLGAGSPCINAGANVGLTADYAGNARPAGAGYDIGAYERQS